MRILVAEDDLDESSLYELTLEARGHVVTTAIDGRTCLRIYRAAAKDAYDVVVLDYLMPFVNGLDVAKEILDINPEQRIIFVSAFVRDTLAKSVKELNKVIEIIEKPFEPEELAIIIENENAITKLHEFNSTNLTTGNVDYLLLKLKEIQKAGRA